MLDAPQAALVARRLADPRQRALRRVRPAALAGLAVGLGVVTKQLVPLYLVGFVACVLVAAAAGATGADSPRSPAWRCSSARRGTCASSSSANAQDSSARPAPATRTVPPAARAADPLAREPRLVRLGDAQRPAARAAVRVRGGRRRRRARAGAHPPGRCDAPTVELLCGLGGAWLGAHADAPPRRPLHDGRDRLRRGARNGLDRAAAAALAALATSLLVAAVPSPTSARPSASAATRASCHSATARSTKGRASPRATASIVYSSLDYLVSGPLRDGDVLGLHAPPARRRRRPHSQRRPRRRERPHVRSGRTARARARRRPELEGFDPPQAGATRGAAHTRAVLRRQPRPARASSTGPACGCGSAAASAVRHRHPRSTTSQ